MASAAVSRVVGPVVGPVFGPVFGRLVGALAAAALLGGGCATAGTAGSIGPVARAGGGQADAPQLVCTNASGLVFARADGSGQQLVAPQPPEPLAGLAMADQLLVGAGSGTVYGYYGREGGWRALGRFGGDGVGTQPLRVATYRTSAIVWLRGDDPGTVPRALEVTPQGQVIEHAVDVAQRQFGAIWQSSNAPLGKPSEDFPPKLKLQVAEARMLNTDASATLVHAELSSWGGRLVAPNIAPIVGDWPDEPLFYVGEPPEDTPIQLTYKGEPLTHRGLIGYGPNAELLFDATFAGQPRGGILVVRPPRGGSFLGKSIDIKPLPAPGLQAPCAFLPAGYAPDAPPPAPPPPAPAAAPAPAPAPAKPPAKAKPAPRRPKTAG